MEQEPIQEEPTFALALIAVFIGTSLWYFNSIRYMGVLDSPLFVGYLVLIFAVVSGLVYSVMWNEAIENDSEHI